MAKTLVVVLLASLAGFLALIFFMGGSTSVTGSAITGGIIHSEENGESSLKTFAVDSSHMKFYVDGVENPDIIVRKGDRVRIEFTSSEGYHDWIVDAFAGAVTEKVREGESSVVEFVADTQGEFSYYCSVGKHREYGMEGKFIVL